MNILLRPIVYICIYTLILGTIVIVKHNFFYTLAFDLGIFVQALYTTWYNRMLLYETPDKVISQSYLGVHFSPILFLLVPLIGLFPYSETLLIFQTIILALPAYFLYKDVYEETRSHKLADLISIWYLLNPSLHGVNLYDFHTQSLMILPSYFLVKALRKHNFKKSIFFTIFLFMINEQVLFICLGCILYLFIKILRDRKQRKMWLKGLVIIMLTTLLMTTMAFITISTLGKPPIHPRNPTKFFPQLGYTWSEVFKKILSSKIIDAIKYDIYLKIMYWLILLFPLYLYNWRIMVKEVIPIISPWMAFTILSGYSPFYTLGWQFNALILGIIAVGVQNTIKIFLTSSHKLYISFIIANLLLSILLSPVSTLPYLIKEHINRGPWIGRAYDFNPLCMDISKELEIASTIRTALSLIPSNASVLCTSNIFPHIANRLEAYVDEPTQPPDFILLDYRYILLLGAKRLTKTVAYLNKSIPYRIMIHANGIILLGRNYTLLPKIVKPYSIHIDPSTLLWKVNISFDKRGYARLNLNTSKEKIIWNSPRLILPPGTYKVIIRKSLENKLTVKIFNHASKKILAISDKTVFRIQIPIDNIIEIKGYFKGTGELTLYGIDIILIDI